MEMKLIKLNFNISKCNSFNYALIAFAFVYSPTISIKYNDKTY